MLQNNIDKGRAVHRTSFVLLLTALVFAPLAFGTVEPWSLAIVETLCFLSLAFILGKQQEAPGLSAPGLMPLALFIAVGVLQTVPLPPSILERLSPGTHSVLIDVSLNSGSHGWHPLTMNLKATLSELLRLSAYAAIYLVSSQTMRDRAHLKSAAMTVLIFGIILSLEAISQHVTAAGNLLWIRPAPEGAQPFGPYVNRNHFAGLMSMMFPLMLGLAFAWRPWSARGAGVLASMTNSANQWKTAAFLFAIGGAVLVAVATFLTGSRSGALVLTGSIAFFALLFMLQRRRSITGELTLLAVVLALIGLALGSFGWGPALERLDTAVALGKGQSFMRPSIWKDALHAFADFPLLGAGMGSFGELYTKYQSFQSEHVVLHAHNDYLELLTGTGAVGFALMGLFLILVLFRAVKGFPRKAEPLPRYLFIGAATGVFAIMVQGLVEFSFQTGANGLFFFFLLGLLAALSAHPPAAGAPSTHPMLRRVALIITLLLTAGAVVFNGGAVMAKLAGPDLGTIVTASTNKKTLAELISASAKASRLDPFEASYRSAACVSERLMGDPQAALAHCTAALYLTPLNSVYRMRAAMVLADLRRDAGAGRLFDAAAITGRFDPEVHARHAQWLLKTGRPGQGFEAMRRAVELDPANTPAYITILALSGVSDEDITHAMPAQSRPFLAYAAYLEGVGKSEQAVLALMDALTHLEAEKAAAPSRYLEIARRLQTLGRPGMALITVEYALDRFPDTVALLHAAARSHEGSGRIREALGLYRHILTLSPNDREAKHAAWRIEDLLKE